MFPADVSRPVGPLGEVSTPLIQVCAESWLEPLRMRLYRGFVGPQQGLKG